MGEVNYKASGVVGSSIKLGSFILDLIKLQVFCILFTCRYFVVAGFFPSICTCIEYYIQKWDKKDRAVPLTFTYFNDRSRAHMAMSNKLAWPLLLFALLISLDLRISELLIRFLPLHILLLIVLILIFGTLLYIFPVYLRYNLGFIQYFRQSFFMFISSVVETIAILFGIAVATFAIVIFPVFLLVGLIPIMLIPLAWFTRQAIQKREAQISKKK